jgi:ketosteroid isomerase-like protein
MRARVIRSIWIALIIAVGFWIWIYFFPSPERAIRKRLTELARSASFGPREGELARVNNAALFSSFFTDDVEIKVDLPGQAPGSFSGRDEMMKAALAARTMAGSLSVEFLDINVTVGSDQNLATANLTAKAKVGNEKDMLVQELKLMLKKIGREWLIYKVETVKTLS